MNCRTWKNHRSSSSNDNPLKRLLKHPQRFGEVILQLLALQDFFFPVKRPGKYPQRFSEATLQLLSIAHIWARPWATKASATVHLNTWKCSNYFVLVPNDPFPYCFLSLPPCRRQWALLGALRPICSSTVTTSVHNIAFFWVFALKWLETLGSTHKVCPSCFWSFQGLVVATFGLLHFFFWRGIWCPDLNTKSLSSSWVLVKAGVAFRGC